MSKKINSYKIKIIIKLHSFQDISFIEFFYFASKYFYNYFKNIYISCFFFKKNKKFIILRSPFVTKKARTQLGFSFLCCSIILQLTVKTYSHVILKLLISYLFKLFLNNKNLKFFTIIRNSQKF